MKANIGRNNPGFKTLVMHDSLTMTFLAEFAFSALLGPMQNPC